MTKTTRPMILSMDESDVQESNRHNYERVVCAYCGKRLLTPTLIKLVVAPDIGGNHACLDCYTKRYKIDKPGSV